MCEITFCEESETLIVTESCSHCYDPITIVLDSLEWARNTGDTVVIDIDSIEAMR